MFPTSILMFGVVSMSEGEVALAGDISTARKQALGGLQMVHEATTRDRRATAGGDLMLVRSSTMNLSGRPFGDQSVDLNRVVSSVVQESWADFYFS